MELGRPGRGTLAAPQILTAIPQPALRIPFSPGWVGKGEAPVIDLLAALPHVQVYRVLYQGRKDSSVEITQVSCGFHVKLPPSSHDFLEPE